MENNDLKEGRIFVLKMIAESYLIASGINNTNDIYKDRTKESLKTITNGDAKALRGWLEKEYQNLGLDLKAIIKRHNEEMTEDKLTNYELKELTEKADKLLIIFGIYDKYKKANEKI